MDVATDAVLVSRAAHVTTITLNRPERLNAMSQPLIDGLVAALEEIVDDRNTWVVVIKGNGRAFCAGADMEHEGFDTGDSEDRLRLFDIAYRVPDLMRRIEAPIITAINGAAAGAGLSIVAASDIRVAATSAFFRLSFVRLGLIPDMGLTVSLPELVGERRAIELALLDERVSAAEALRIGLVTKVVPDEQLGATVDEIVARLAALPPVAVRHTKSLLARSRTDSYASSIDREKLTQNSLHQTSDVKEGVRAFREKRPPQFTGE